jgi:hypothetical protein
MAIVPEMKVPIRLMLAACALALLPAPAFAADKRVYKIDSLIASLKHGVITVQASGAVQTGGWTKPHLHVLHNDGHTITVEFLAAAPPPGMTVIEAIVPVTAAAQIKSRGRIASVHAIAEANEITAQVLH